MKILLCHNYYSQPGGEDASFLDEARLLEAHGHEVVYYTRHSASIEHNHGRLDLAVRTVWNREAHSELRALMAAERPDVVHCTNTLPLISPAVYDAARAEGVPVVQALRNYRLVCPSGVLARSGRLCRSCVGRRVAWPSVAYGCYRGSRTASAVVSSMLAIERARHGWDEAVDLFFAPTEFARGVFVDAGLPAERIAVKPNFVSPDPGPGPGDGGFAVFVGRHAPEKGIATLLDAWQRIEEPMPLKFLGDGPLADDVVRASQRDRRIEWLGRRSSHEVLETVGKAAFLVMPSTWYETFGRTIIEAFARGTPVLVSGIGAMAELVHHGETGFHFQPGDPADLADKARRLIADEGLRARMRQAARREYLERYTAEPNLRMLADIYDRARRIHAARGNGVPVA